MATVLAAVGAEFERVSGTRLSVITGYSPSIVQQLNDGEPFDIVATLPKAIDELARNGKVIGTTRKKLFRSGNGVEVRAGVPKPDVSSIDAFKRTLLNAGSIGYLPVSGVPELVTRLGIADAIRTRVTMPNADVVSVLVAKGELEVGIVVTTQILTTPGVDLVGPLPPEIQIYATFEGAVATNSRCADAARALIEFLTGPIATPVVKAQGMQPC